MKTFIEGDTTINYNSDLSGLVQIKNFSGEIKLEFKDLIKFVAETFVRPSLIKIIENADAKDLLLGQFNPLE